MRNLFRNALALLAVLSVLVPVSAAQNTTSAVVGVVTDSSGAVLPGTAVTLHNPSTGADYKARTNSAGSYRFGDVAPGPGYVMTFSHEGFSDAVVKGVYVNVGAARTQDAKLLVGSATTLEVNAAGEGVTINTDDASIGNNVQVEQLNELPVQSRTSPAVLFTLQPGVAGNSVTGARTDQTNVTVDGLDVNDFATGSFGAITAGAPVDSVQEFRGTVAGFQVNSGQGSGGQFQLVTKSGTNHFHGNLNEYHRDNSTVANTWFNDNSTPPVRAAKLVRNQFGGNLGGPIKKDKLFFFANVLESRIAQQSNVARTVPLPSFVAGNITYRNNSIANCDSATMQTNPSCFSTLTAAQLKALDPAGIGYSPAVQSLLKLFPTPNDLTGGDGANTALYRFNADAGDNLSNYVGKIDYQLTPKLHLAGVGNVARENSVQSTAQFPGLPNAGEFVDRSYRYAVYLDWQINRNMFNRVAYGASVQDYSFPRASNPLGVNQIGFSSGTTTLLSTPYSSPVNAQFRHVPIPQVTDDFTWSVGRHNINAGGFFKWIHTSSGTFLDYNSYTIGMGGNVQGLSAGSPLRPANLSTTTQATVNYDEAFAVLLGRVGESSSTFNYNNQGQALNLDSGSKRDYQYYQTMLFAGDSWKITPRLTLNYGANYQIYSVPYEKNGLQSVQTLSFDTIMSARVAQSAAGNISPTAVPFITYVLGGKANNGPGYYNMAWGNVAPRVSVAFQPDSTGKTVFNAGAGIVYDRTIVDAVQYQQDQYSYLFSQPNPVPFGNPGNPEGSFASVAAGGDPRYDNPPAATAPPTPKPPFTPYVTGTTPNGLISGVFNETTDPTFKTPYSIAVNGGMEHEFPGSLVFRLSYAGRFGRRLLAQADTAQLVNFTDPKSGEDMGTAFANVEQKVRAALQAGTSVRQIAPEPWFESVYGTSLPPTSASPSTTGRIANAGASLLQKGDFADFIQGYARYMYGGAGYNVGMNSQFAENSEYTNKGFSTYHGMLVSLSQNLKHGLRYDVNYTWSHSMDNVSVVANTPAIGGYGFICDALRMRLCRGNSDFDITSVFNTNFLYSLPIGRGRTFGSNMPLWLSEVVGGWDVSGIVVAQSGQAFGTVSSAFVAGYANNAPAILTGNPAALHRNVHKQASGKVTLFDNPTAALAAFTAPTGFQIGSRNNLRGPKFVNFDAGLAKSLALWPEKNMNLKFRADAFNVLNHPNFASPGNNTNYDDITQASNFGQLTGTTGTYRVVQLIVRLEF